MNIYTYLTGDHERLGLLLTRATKGRAEIDINTYMEFRQGLLRHIGIEEKVILPAIDRIQDRKQSDVAQKLRLDHGALVALLVPCPSLEIIETIRSILAAHNPLEEGKGGLYELVQKLAGGEAGELFAKVESFPEVQLLPLNDNPDILDVTRRAVERAGYKPAF